MKTLMVVHISMFVRGGTINCLMKYIHPAIHECNPSDLLIYTARNDMVNFNWENSNWKRLGMKEVMFLSVFIKQVLKISKIIEQVNDLLIKMYMYNSFHYVHNDNITRGHLQKDRIHLSKTCTDLLIIYFNIFILNESNGN